MFLTLSSNGLNLEAPLEPAAGTSSASSSAMAAGSDRADHVASISSATATPKPICWNMTRSPRAKPRTRRR